MPFCCFLQQVAAIGDAARGNHDEPGREWVEGKWAKVWFGTMGRITAVRSKNFVDAWISSPGRRRESPSSISMSSSNRMLMIASVVAIQNSPRETNAPTT